jgi:3-oxoacyl-(acyl-carrier-protein) synthase
VSAAVRRACARARRDDIGWIKAHGTGSRVNDTAEFRGLSTAIGSRLAEVPLVSLKPALGHCLGASGVVEAVGALLALEEGFVPATLGSSAADPRLEGCRLSTRVQWLGAYGVLMLSESFGGRCAAILAVRP